MARVDVEGLLDDEAIVGEVGGVVAICSEGPEETTRETEVAEDGIALKTSLLYKWHWK